MVEADRLPPSILDIYKVFEHIDIIDMLSIGIQQQPCYTVHPHYLDQILRFWVTCDDVIMSWLRLTSFSYPF